MEASGKGVGFMAGLANGCANIGEEEGKAIVLCLLGRVIAPNVGVTAVGDGTIVTIDNAVMIGSSLTTFLLMRFDTANCDGNQIKRKRLDETLGFSDGRLFVEKNEVKR